jgi:dienelactone hydrolase
MSECVNSKAWPAWVRTLLPVLLLTGIAAAAPPDAVFRIDGQRPIAAVITAGVSWDESVQIDTPMGRLAAGVLDTYDTRSIATLLRCATRQPVPTDAETRRVAVIHLAGRHPGAGRTVEIMQLADSSWAARALPQGAGIILDRNRFEAITSTWPVYRGGFGHAPDPDTRGTSVSLTKPYIAGAITLDARTQKQRLYRGMPIRTLAPDRVLDDEVMHVRLPAGYDPRTPAGLLIWSSPSPRGSIPRVFGNALDELNLVCIGSDNTGNDRDVPDKFQMVFDAVATARQRCHIDDRRIYITGMSGGGKVTSILAMCFPDVFSGAIPIVGFGCYSTLDDSWAEHRNAYFAEPRGRLLQLARTHRMALVSGPPDFNYAEMTARAARLEADGFRNIRFFSYPDMAHVMPTPERFAEAMRWVDEPWQQVRAQERTQAESLLAAYLNARQDPAPVSDEDRAMLALVTEVGPWTEAAWRAFELLRD